MTTAAVAGERTVYDHRRPLRRVVVVLLAALLAGLVLGARAQAAGATTTPNISLDRVYDDGGQRAAAAEPPGAGRRSDQARGPAVDRPGRSSSR